MSIITELKRAWHARKNYSHVNSMGLRYYLNAKDVTLRGGKIQTIYYFSRDFRADTATKLPAGFAINENPRNGFLTIATPRMQEVRNYE